jgi:hypothetical protein
MIWEMPIPVTARNKSSNGGKPPLRVIAGARVETKSLVRTNLSVEVDGLHGHSTSLTSAPDLETRHVGGSADLGSAPRLTNRKPKTWDRDQRIALASLLRGGQTYRQAAKTLGVHPGSVCWATARYGIGRPAANLSRATGHAAEGWTEAKLTQRWADRKAHPQPNRSADQ